MTDQDPMSTGIERVVPGPIPVTRPEESTVATAGFPVVQAAPDRICGGALLPLLSTVMGHVNPASTYWYLTSTPELMAPVAARLESVFEGER